MTRNQILVLIFAILNILIIHSQLLFPSLIIGKEIVSIFSWVLIAGALIAKYLVLLSLSKASAKKIAFLSVAMTVSSELFALLPLMLLDMLISIVYNTDGAYFIAWFVFSIIFKTIIEEWVAHAYLPQIDQKTLYLWLAIIHTILTTVGALGYVFTYYIKIV